MISGFFSSLIGHKKLSQTVADQAQADQLVGQNSLRTPFGAARYG